MSREHEFLDQVDRIAREEVARDAAEVDREARFPAAAIAALGQAGLLGLISAREVGGLGLGLRAAAQTVERLARECGSTAMVVCMHYAATAVIEKLGPEPVRRDIAAGKHLTTLAFSEAGPRSQFWAPLSTATPRDGTIRLTARKSWATSAHAAHSYVWSSKPVAAAGASTLWLVPAGIPGLRVDPGFDGLGLRGNDSCGITAEDAAIDPAARLGDDGGGFAIMLEQVLPWFNVMAAACSIGLAEAATARTAEHAAGTRFTHADGSIADLPTARAYLARMRITTDMARGLWLDTLDAIEAGRPDAVLRVLEVKAGAGDAVAAVVDLGMRVAGGAAYRRELAVERYFRDARAGLVMAPTSDVLYDFIGKAMCGLPLF